MNNKRDYRLHVKLLLSMISVVAGVSMCMLCIFIPPKGEIHASVLAFMGECLAFAGALVSITTNSRIRQMEINERLTEFEEKISHHMEEHDDFEKSTNPNTYVKSMDDNPLTYVKSMDDNPLTYSNNERNEQHELH